MDVAASLDVLLERELVRSDSPALPLPLLIPVEVGDGADAAALLS